MNAIDKAIQDVFYAVPRKLLDIAFIKYNSSVNNYQMSLSAIIRDTVVIPRVMTDCNLIGGSQVHIPINRCELLEEDDYKVVIRVPMSLTNGRSIVSVSELSERMVDVGSRQSNLSDLSAQLVKPLPNFDSSITTQLRLIGENVVFIENVQPFTFQLELECLVENDKAMSNLAPAFYQHFSKLVTLAVKAHIYNACIINMDEAYVQSGATIGVLKSIVESYADANELYQTFFAETWSKVSIMADQSRYEQQIRGSIAYM